MRGAAACRREAQRDLPRIALRQEARLEETIAAIIKRRVEMDEGCLFFSLVFDFDGAQPVNRVHHIKPAFGPNQLLLQVGALNRKWHLRFLHLIAMKLVLERHKNV